MGLFSFLRKNKQDAAPGKSEYRSQSDDPFTSARAGSKPRRASKEAADPILPEKKRARRRLIGAVVLVLAVVIVLPMILDPEPKPLPDDVVIRIPSKDVRAPAVAENPVEVAAPVAAQVLTETAADDKTLAKTENIAREQAADRQAQSASVNAVEKVSGKAPEKALDKPATAPQKSEKPIAPAAEPRQSPATRPSEEERALAILQGKSSSSGNATAKHPAKAAASDKAAGKFVIQIAALATQEKVDELRSKLSAAGIKSYTQKVATQAGDRTRIRVGPFASRDEADKARAKIVSLGLSATLVPV